MNLLNYRGIIFDFFGVISSEVASTWIAKNIEDEKKQNLAYQYLYSGDKGDISYNELLEGFFNLTAIPQKRINKEWRELAIINTELIKKIQKLKITHKIALCSDAPSEFLRSILKDNNLESLFNIINISSEQGTTKKEIHIFKDTLDKLGLSASQVVFIDDNNKNIDIAKSIGIKSYGYKTFKNILDEYLRD